MMTFIFTIFMLYIIGTSILMSWMWRTTSNYEAEAGAFFVTFIWLVTIVIFIAVLCHWKILNI